MSQYAKSKQDERKKTFKKGIDAGDARKKREEQAVRIRKDKRIESFQKRRHLGTDGEVVTFGTNAAERLQEMTMLVNMVKSNDPSKMIEATGRIRKLLSIEHNPPIQDVIDAGIVPRMVDFLTLHDHPQLQFEAAWALTNIASGTSDQTRFVLESGAVPRFRDLLSSSNDDVREQAVWALGNIAGDSPQCRDFVLSHDIMEPLLQNLIESSRISMLRNGTWSLSNLCRGKPQPPWDLVSPALPTLARLIYSTDEEVLTDACWALSYLSDGPNERIQAVIENGISRRMVELLLHQSFSVQTPALRTIGNIVTGDDVQTQIVINLSVLSCLLALLSSGKKGIRKEACWTISNITAGNRAQIQAAIEARIIPRLIQLLKTSDFDIKKEAAWALSNATSGGSPEQIRYMVDQGLIEPLLDLLTASEPRVVLVALEALDNLLRVGDRDSRETGVNEYANEIEKLKGIDRIEQLNYHPNQEIYEKAVSILETFFQAEEDQQNTMPNVSPDAFKFGLGAPTGSSGFNF